MSSLSNVLSFARLKRIRKPFSMDRGGKPPETDQDLIGSATSEREVIEALAQRGCSDLTAEIDLATCGDLPRAGGGVCDVYQGSLNRGTKIAIKSLRIYDQPGKDNGKGKILKRAARELYFWSKLKHPNVLPLMGLAIFRGHLSMISEWMENGNLMAYLSLNSDVDPVGLCINVCAGLSYIHDNDMVHGDLKAANVMVSHDGIVMIADFGNSKLRDLTLKFTNTTSSNLTIRWAAPELLDSGDNGPQVSKKSDVYAFGMTVLEILTRQVPFEEFSDQQVLSMVALKRRIPARPANGSARPDIRIIEELLRDVYFQAWVEARRRDSSSTGHPKINESAMPEVALTTTKGSGNPLERYRKGLQDLSNLATEHLTQGQLEKSELLVAEVLAAKKRVLGADHLDILLNMNNLAVTYDKQGRLAEAESLYVEVAAAKNRVLGADHPDTLRSMHNLALKYDKQCRLEEAAWLFTEVLAARRRVLGADHPETLLDMHNLAVMYNNRGRLAEAESLFAETLAARKRLLEADHPDTLLNMHNLAVTYNKQGRSAEAESLFVEVLAGRKRVLGADHPETLRSMHGLAVTYDDQGRLAEAEPLFADALAARKRVLGADHPQTLQSMHNLAVTYDKQDRLAEAESLYAEILVTQKRVLGADHPRTLWSMNMLAALYNKQSRLAEAESLYAKPLGTQKRAPGAVVCKEGAT